MKAARFSCGAIVIAGLLVAVAVTAYPGGTFLEPRTAGYSFFGNSLSDLGATTAWNGDVNRIAATWYLAASAFFLIGASLAVVELIPVYARIASRRILGSASVLLLIGASALVGVMLAPEDVRPAVHGRLTLVALAAFPLASALLAVATWRRPFRRIVPVSWLSLTVVLVLWAAVMPWRPTTIWQLAIPVGIQKLATFMLAAVLLLQTAEARDVRAVTPNPRANP